MSPHDALSISQPQKNGGDVLQEFTEAQIARVIRDVRLDLRAKSCARRARRAGRLAAGVVIGMLALALSAGAVSAQAPDRPRLDTNETYVEDATRTTSLAITDPMAVFAFVLESLPDRVKVYPTENYYYFRFIHNGTRYAGNIRLDPRERDQGKVQFSYYPDLREWKDQMQGDIYVVLDATRGVTVELVERLVYRLSYRGKSVVFALNDLCASQAAGGRAWPRREVPGSDLRRVRPSASS